MYAIAGGMSAVAGIILTARTSVGAPVTGIAMGMISDSETGKYAILSDILGDEDHLGDMDFKVTGTAEGITACQMDIKIDGLWVADEVTMETVKKKHKTTIVMTDTKVNQGLNDDEFTIEKLKDSIEN